MKRQVYLSWAAGAITLAACNLLEEPTATTVQGVFLNKYTRQPLVGIPIAVRSWHYSLGNSWTDSIAGARTDSNGRYSIGFSATSKGAIYRVDFKYNRQLYDLTDYSRYWNYSIYDGVPLDKGRSNTVDFEATPLVLVRVLIELDKRGAAGLSVNAFADERDGQGYFHALTFYGDTARATPHVSAVATSYFVPNRTYVFSIYRSPVAPATYGTWVRSNHRVGYNDTTTIRLR